MAETLTRDAVIAATRDLIQDDGLEALSLRKVGASLGVTAPALYAHVEGRRDILRSIADSEFHALVRRFESISEADPIERIRRYCHAYLEHARSAPELFKVMFQFQPRTPAGAPIDAELASATRAFAIPTAALEEAIAHGNLREADATIATFTMWSAIHGAADVLLMGFRLDPAFEARLVDSVIETLIRGLSS